ncbi:hypothetical protein R6Q59_032318 [Mikania micrantha]
MAHEPIIKVAAISGSLRKASIHHGLIRSAIDLTTDSIDGMSIEHIDISSLPMLNTDLEIDDEFPPEVETFRQKILHSDCFLFASPEYNYTVTAPLKNAIDWASRLPMCGQIKLLLLSVQAAVLVEDCRSIVSGKSVFI